MSIHRLIKPNDFKTRRPDPERIQQYIDELDKLELAEHLSDHPKYKGLKYVALSAFAREQLLFLLRDCKKWVENPDGKRIMIGGKVFTKSGDLYKAS